MQPDQLNAFMPASGPPVLNAASGPLCGASLAVKDIFDVAGFATGCGNPQKLAEARPARKTAGAVQSLLDAGASFAGKTQTDELAFSLTGHNAHYPQPINPKAPNRVTGGSSAGSAAAVAGGLVDIATGSDTGGSIRAPASYCGLIGLRATHGRISLDGTMPLAPSFDTFGWFAATGSLYEAVGRVLLGPDERPVTLSRPLCVGALDLFVDVGASGAYREARAIIERHCDQRATDVSLSHELEDLYWCFRNLQAEEAWQSHRDWLSLGDRQLGPGVKERFQYGASVDKDTVTRETGRRQSFTEQLSDLIGVDGFIIMPTVPGPAPLRAAQFADQQAYRERALHLLCLAGLSGLPQITLPMGDVDNAPFGISLLGPPNCDLALIELGRAILKSIGRDG